MSCIHLLLIVAGAERDWTQGGCSVHMLSRLKMGGAGVSLEMGGAGVSLEMGWAGVSLEMEGAGVSLKMGGAGV